MSGAAIIGLGTAAPPGVPCEKAIEFALARCCGTERERRALRVLYTRSGVAERGSVLVEGSTEPDVDPLGWFYPVEGPGPTTAVRLREFVRRAPRLAVAAGRAALRDAGTSADEITHLVLATCTGFDAPDVEAGVRAGLGLPLDVGRFQIGFMGCHAAINALEVAGAIVCGSSSEARVLVVCVELCSVHFQYGWKPQQLVANALFADGAAAIVVGPARAPWSIAATGSRIIPGTAGEMTWRIGDHGFEMTLSPRVPALVAEEAVPWLVEWLGTVGLAPADVGSWAIHAGGPRIIRAAAEALDLPADALHATFAVLREHGNLSSATVPFILARLRADHAPLPCVAVGFGPGLAVEAMLFIDDAAIF